MNSLSLVMLLLLALATPASVVYSQDSEMEDASTWFWSLARYPRKPSRNGGRGEWCDHPVKANSAIARWKVADNRSGPAMVDVTCSASGERWIK